MGRTVNTGAAALVVVAVAVLMLLLPTWPQSGTDVPSDVVPVEPVGDRYAITYVTDGGELAGDAPASYLEGEYTELPHCVNGDRYFEGWFLDADLTEPLGAVTRTMSGDITLYASWGDFSRLGSTFTMDLDGGYTIGSVPYSVEGTLTWTYMAVADNGAHYVQRSGAITYTAASVGFHSVSDRTHGYWTDEPSDSVFRYIGNGEVDGMVCEMWSDGEETQWLYRNMYPVRMEYSSGTSYQTYTLVSAGHVECGTPFLPDVMCGHPLTVTHPGECLIGDTVELTAVGDGFAGWYVDGELETADRTLTVDRIDPLKTYDARSDSGYTVMDGNVLDPSEYPGDGTLEMVDGDGSVTTVTGPVGLDPGIHRVRYVDSGTTVYLDVLVDEDRVFTHRWTYAGRMYSMELPMDLATVARDSYDDPYGDRRYQNGTPDEVGRYITVDNTYVVTVADRLAAMGEGMDGRSMAEFVLRFVQEIPYLSDTSSRGETEFWKYPSETLWDGGGDCEDSSILYGCIMERLGYDTCLMVFYDHAMVGVALGDLNVPGDDTFTHDGTVYTFAETTNTVLGYWSTGRGYAEQDILYVYGFPEPAQ